MAGPSATAQYEEVRAKIEEGLSVKEAIEAVAHARGMTKASVQTVYYRTAKELGGGSRRPSLPHSAGDSPTSEELLRQAIEALTTLAERASAQEKDLERLRRIERALTES